MAHEGSKGPTAQEALAYIRQISAARHNTVKRLGFAPDVEFRFLMAGYDKAIDDVEDFIEDYQAEEREQ